MFIIPTLSLLVLNDILSDISNNNDSNQWVHFSRILSIHNQDNLGGLCSNDSSLMTESNLSKIKPKFRTTGQVTGNFGVPKVRTNGNTELGHTTKESIHPLTTQDEYLNRMYDTIDKTNDPKIVSFCYQQIKQILIQRGIY